MAENTEDLNSLRVALDMARQPPASSTIPPSPGLGPEMAEALAEGKGGGVGGKAAPDLAAPSYAGVQDGTVLLAPPGFTVCESFFDSGEFTCFHPEIVCGTEVTILDDGTFQMNDDVWCNVTVENGAVSDAALATASDPSATVSVHVADIRPDGVKQYHVGAIVLGTGGGAPADAIPGNFEPEFYEGVLIGASEGFVPFGRYFRHVISLSLASSSRISDGYVYLATEHSLGPVSFAYVELKTVSVADPTNGSSWITALQEFARLVNNPTRSDDPYTTTNIPLYKIRGGKLAVDYRAAMSLALRE